MGLSYVRRSGVVVRCKGKSCINLLLGLARDHRMQ